MILLIETFSLATKLFIKSLASLALIGSAFQPFNSGVSIQASLIFSPFKVVQVSPDEEKRVDHIFVRRKKICIRHPEGFATEEIARFDIAWPEEPKEELEASTEEKEEIKISTD